MIDKTKSNSAFTLAEVLITLVIIGVVAALTIPNVIYNSKKHEYSARLKKFYSTMKQVQQRADANGNGWRDFIDANVGVTGDNVAVSFIDEYLFPYLSFSKKDGSYIYLNDGSSVRLNKSTNCFQFYFDVNGDKKPNVAGRDIQVFEYCQSAYNGPKLTFGPYKRNNNLNSRADALTECTNGGITCSALLWFDGWEFKDDYPYRL